MTFQKAYDKGVTRGRWRVVHLEGEGELEGTLLGLVPQLVKLNFDYEFGRLFTFLGCVLSRYRSG